MEKTDVSNQRQKGHVTIRKGLSFPPLLKCRTCCIPGQYHCPFCSPAFFKPSKRSRVLLHLEIHLRRAFFIEEYTIHKCALECVTRPHYHCLYCVVPLPNKLDLRKHIMVCQERKSNPKLYGPQDVGTSDAALGENLDSSFTIESDENSESVEMTVDTDSHSQEGSSNMTAARSVSKSSTRHAKRHRDPAPFKCDRMIQTNIEKPQDCDEFYFMNLVKLFKRLTPHKKTEVRMKIERILFEAEFN